MKLLLVKCSICSNWYGPWRGHCNSCGATMPITLKGKTFHLDVGNNKQIVKGFYEYRMSGRDWAIDERNA